MASPVPGWDVVVCRGCCCGTQCKHPQTDHEEQLDLIRQAAQDRPIRVVVADCLDRCAESNVVVLRPSRPARKTGARPVWLGRVLEPSHTRALCEWLRRGGPTVEALPSPLQKHCFRE